MLALDMSWDPTEFQATVNALLERRGWSQNDLARATATDEAPNGRISQTAVNAWLLHGRKPRPETQAILAEVSELDYDDLMQMCGYSKRRVGARARSPEVISLFTLIESSYDNTPDPHLRRAGINGIDAFVRSIWNAHPKRRPNRRRQEPEQPPKEEGYAHLTYALIGAT